MLRETQQNWGLNLVRTPHSSLLSHLPWPHMAYFWLQKVSWNFYYRTTLIVWSRHQWVCSPLGGFPSLLVPRHNRAANDHPGSSGPEKCSLVRLLPISRHVLCPQTPNAWWNHGYRHSLKLTVQCWDVGDWWLSINLGECVHSTHSDFPAGETMFSFTL